MRHNTTNTTSIHTDKINPHIKEIWQLRMTKIGSLEALRERSEHVTRTIFDKATRSLGTIRVMSKVALIAGSSQQGKALRASVAWREAQRERTQTESLCV